MKFLGKVETIDQFKSTLAAGKAPLQVSSNTVVANLNAELLEGKHASDFVQGSFKITVSNTPPTTPSKNDWWLDTSV